jgi:hypothetical protein
MEEFYEIRVILLITRTVYLIHQYYIISVSENAPGSK